MWSGESSVSCGCYLKSQLLVNTALHWSKIMSLFYFLGLIFLLKPKHKFILFWNFLTREVFVLSTLQLAYFASISSWSCVPDTLHVTKCHVSPVTCHLSPVTCHLSHVTCYLPWLAYFEAILVKFMLKPLEACSLRSWMAHADKRTLQLIDWIGLGADSGKTGGSRKSE